MKFKHILRKLMFVLVCGLTGIGMAYGSEIAIKAGHITQGLLLMVGAMFWSVGMFLVDDIYD
jgi:hypothetical protein